MENTIKVQLYIFLTSVYGGLIFGLAFDIYRAIRYYCNPNKIVTILEDLLFWVFLSFIFFYILNKSSWSSLRGYIFIGFIIGGIIYLKLLSKILFPLWLKLFKGFIILIRNVLRIIKFPIVKVRGILALKKNRINRIKRVPREAFNDIKKYKRILSSKK
ncbi:spore cortex biosynthesis protein YabQ [Tepidimicrobium xylanilyticum]|uniref:spore cortex biosynthesis protein YabQ n=1 Tax=Tepidimicrobium xylanilyticum TaxID=1123352 RepID=UPI002654EBAD|nr:spore cortex biosynthesis protein YabQ [Tepidimicrobium xylanilyticum]GMG97567.1 hypothetical protein EN5CB1_23930 [Tepidimicrobium xylanilyticum]